MHHVGVPIVVCGTARKPYVRPAWAAPGPRKSGRKVVRVDLGLMSLRGAVKAPLGGRELPVAVELDGAPWVAWLRSCWFVACERAGCFGLRQFLRTPLLVAGLRAVEGGGAGELVEEDEDEDGGGDRDGDEDCGGDEGGGGESDGEEGCGGGESDDAGAELLPETGGASGISVSEASHASSDEEYEYPGLAPGVLGGLPPGDPPLPGLPGICCGGVCGLI